MSYLLTITFLKRDFKITLWKDSLEVAHKVSNNASKNLILSIDSLLRENEVSLAMITKIGFLSGPGSFTSARILCATCFGIKTAYPDIIIVPILINEAMHVMKDYEKTAILLRCNKHVWHVYQSDWEIVPEGELGKVDLRSYTTLDELPESLIATPKPWPDLSVGMMRVVERTAIQVEIEPYYGLI